MLLISDDTVVRLERVGLSIEREKFLAFTREPHVDVALQFVCIASVCYLTSACLSFPEIAEWLASLRVMEFEEVAAHFGYSLGVGAIPVKKFAITDRQRDPTKRRREIVMADSNVAVSSRHYQRLVGKIEGKPEERILSYLMLRSLKQARYAAESLGQVGADSIAIQHAR